MIYLCYMYVTKERGMPQSNLNLLEEKALFSAKLGDIYIPGHGFASLNRLIPEREFENGAQSFYITAEEMNATHLIVTYFDSTPELDKFISTIADAMLHTPHTLTFIHPEPTDARPPA